MSVIGYATLQVIPSLRGVGASINQQWAAVGTGAAAKAGAQSGQAYGKGMSQAAEGVARGTSSQVSNLLGTALKGGTVALAAAGAFGLYKASQAASEFETRISAVGAVSGASAGELDSLRGKALQLGADTSFSASESASAIEELVKAGISVGDVMSGAADATVALAAAGEVDLTTAATIASNAMNAFELSASALPGVADTIAGAANASAIDVDQFGLSLSQAAATANLVGFSFEDTATAIALLGNAGIVGSDAGTSLKTMLSTLTPATEKQRTEMEKLGLMTEEGTSKFFDAEGGVKSLEEVSGLLQSSLAGLSEEQQILALRTIFGSDAQRAAAVFMSEGADGASSLAEEIAKIDAEDVAAKRLDNLAGDVEQLGGSIETLLIKGGTPFNTWLRELVQAGTAATNWLADPPEGFTDFLADMADTAETRLLPIWDDLYEAGSDIVDILGDMWEYGSPVVELFGRLAGTALVGTLSAAAASAAALTGAIAGNETAIKLLVGGLAVLAANRAVNMLDLDFAGLGRSIRNVATGSLRNLGTSLGNLVSPTTVVAAGVFGLIDAWDSAAKKAEELAEANNVVRDSWDSFGIEESIRQTGRALDEQQEKFAGYSGALDTLWGGITAALPGVESGILNNARAVDELTEAQANLEGQQARLNLASQAVATGLNISEVAARELMRRLEYDPATMTTEDLIAGVNKELNQLNGNDPKTENIQVALQAITDEAVDVTEKIDAFKQALDDVFAPDKNYFDAITSYEAGFRDLGVAVFASGGSFDVYSEKGNAARAAVSSFFDDAVDKASTAVDDMTASGVKYGDAVAIATAGLREARDRIIDLGVDAGRSREDMELLADQMGLTEGNLEILIAMQGGEEGKALLDELKAKKDEAGGEVRVEAKVDANPALGALAGLEGTIAELMKSSPTLVATLNDDDVTNDAAALEESLEAWGTWNPTISAFLNDNPFMVRQQAITGFLAWYEAQQPSATALFDTYGAQIGFSSLASWNAWWDQASPEARAELNKDPAEIDFGWLNAIGTHWDARYVEAEAANEASGAAADLNYLIGLADRFRLTVEQALYVATGAGSLGMSDSRPNPSGRWGAVTAYAKGGVTPAHITRDQLFKYGEPETGGEAFIPRIGNKARSLAILEQAAAWYGMGITPMARGGIARGRVLFEDEPGWNWQTMGNMRAGADIVAQFPNGLLGDTNQNGLLDPGEWERWDQRRVQNTGALTHNTGTLDTNTGTLAGLAANIQGLTAATLASAAAAAQAGAAAARTVGGDGILDEDEPGWNWRTMGNQTAGADIMAQFVNGLLGDTNQNGRLEPGEWERWWSSRSSGARSGYKAPTASMQAPSEQVLAHAIAKAFANSPISVTTEIDGKQVAKTIHRHSAQLVTSARRAGA